MALSRRRAFLKTSLRHAASPKTDAPRRPRPKHDAPRCSPNAIALAVVTVKVDAIFGVALVVVLGGFWGRAASLETDEGPREGGRGERVG